MPDVFLEPADYLPDIAQFLNEWFYDMPNVLLYMPEVGNGYRANYMGQDSYILYDDGWGGAAVYTNKYANDAEVILCICPGEEARSLNYSKFIFADDEDRNVQTYTKSEFCRIIESYLYDLALPRPEDLTEVIDSVLNTSYDMCEPFGSLEDVLAYMEGADIYPFNEDCQKASVAAKQIKWLN